MNNIKLFYFFVVFTLLFSFSCVHGAEIPDNIKCEKDNLYNDVKFLTEIYPYRNQTNPQSLNKAASYIYNELSKLNCKVNYQVFKAGGIEYKNIIASFNPDKKETIIIGAHYDVCGDQPGADDNASAVAGLLELARMIDRYKPLLKYRVDFVAYALEEPPYYKTEFMGSMVHAKYVQKNKIKLKLMICLEMIGYFSDKEGSQEYPIDFLKKFYPEKGNFIALITKLGQGRHINRLKKFMNQASSIDVETLCAPKALEGIDFSDHQSYWKSGYNAVMVTDTSFNRNRNYHRKTDTIDTLDFDKMAEVIKGLYWAVINY